MNRTWICVVFIIGLSVNLIAAEKTVRQYEIRLAGFKIGDLTATRTIVNDSVTHYELDSKVSFWLFYRVEVAYTNTSTYLNGKMTRSTVKTITNKENYHTKTRWVNNRYEIEVDAYEYKKDTFLTQPVRFNIPKIYFEEPKGNGRVYTDGYGVLTQFEPVDEKYYLVEVVGNRNKYFFKDGMLERASMDSPIKNYEIQLIK